MLPQNGHYDSAQLMMNLGLSGIPGVPGSFPVNTGASLANPSGVAGIPSQIPNSGLGSGIAPGIGSIPLLGSIPAPPPIPHSRDEALLALNLFYVQSAMAQLQAQKDMLNSRLLAQSLLSHPENESIPPSPASMSPTRTESLSPSPDEKMSHRHQIHHPYRRKRSQERQEAPKKAKNSRSRHHATPAHPADVKQTFLDLYEVYGVIGVGGGGMVYAGRRITDKLPVAIKRVMREKVKRWEKVQGHNVPQEIALMLRVYGHKGVIKLVDWYECLDSFILIMERPENSVDLFDYIRESGRMTESEAKIIFKQVVEAVGHIHSCGVVHRDIKDENVILNRESGEVKLIDFGCGTLLKEAPYRDFSGTPEFYPPEWFESKIYHARYLFDKPP